MKTKVCHTVKNTFKNDNLKERKRNFNIIAEKYLNYTENIHIKHWEEVKSCE